MNIAGKCSCSSHFSIPIWYMGKEREERTNILAFYIIVVLQLCGNFQTWFCEVIASFPSRKETLTPLCSSCKSVPGHQVWKGRSPFPRPEEYCACHFWHTGHFLQKDHWHSYYHPGKTEQGVLGNLCSLPHIIVSQVPCPFRMQSKGSLLCT